MSDNKVELNPPFWLKLLGVLTLFITLIYTVFAGAFSMYFYFFGETVKVTEDSWAHEVITLTTPGGDIWPLIWVFCGFVILIVIYGAILGFYKGWFDEQKTENKK